MDLVTRLKLTNNEFNSGIDSSKKKVQELQDTADDASKSIQDLGSKGGKSAKDLLSEMANTEKAARSASNYSRQLKEIQKTIADLTIGYRNMSSEMKDSELGKEVAAKISELTQKAAEYKDAIADVNQEITKIASDTAGWDGMKQGIDMVSSSLQTFVATGVLGEKSTEKLVAVIAKLKAIEAATNSVIKIGNALQKNSALMTSIATIQTKALARAKDLETAATGKATIAQKLFNTVAKANPYVLLAAAILAVVGAIAAFTIANKKNADQLDKTKIAQEAYNKALDKAKEESSTTIAKFVLLEQQYKRLRTEGDKKKWIEDNTDAFKELGYKIEDVNTADDVFINHAKDVIRAMELRARAAAIMEVYQEKYAEAYRKSLELEEKGNKKPSTPQVNTKNLKEAGLEYGKDYTNRTNPAPVPGGVSTVTPVLTDEGKAKWEAYWKGKGEEAKEAAVDGMSGMLEEATKLIAEAEGIDAKYRASGKSGGSGGGGKTKIEADVELTPGSLAAAQKAVQDLEKELNNMSPDDTKFEETKQKLVEAKAEVERIQKLIKGVEPSKKLELVPNSLAEANYFVQSFQKELQNLDPNTDEFKEISDLLDYWKKKQEEINNIINKQEYPVGSLVEANKKVQELSDKLSKLKPETNEFKETLELLNQWKKKQEEINNAIDNTGDIVSKYDKIVAEADKINLQVQIGAMDPAEGRRQIAELNKKLSDLHLTATVELEFDTDISKLTAKMNNIASMISAPINAINNVKNAYDSMIDKLKDPKADGWDKFFSAFQLGMTVIESLTTVLTVLDTVLQLLNKSQEENTASTLASAGAAASDATAQTSDATATASNAAMHGAAAATKGAESVASIPIAGPILAVVAIATILGAVIAAIASLSKFATGGIVGGNSRIGDNNLIRANAGEMVLNNRQQANLFKMLDEGRQERNRGLGGDVEFKIQGTQLVGVLNNYNKKTSKI